MGLSQLLENSIKDAADDQGPWRQFVLDHLDWIKVRCKSYQIDELVMNQYRHDLDRFLREKEEFRTLLDMSWIVLLLNDLTSDLEFKTPGIYVIPTDGLINGLFHSFNTHEANAK